MNINESTIFETLIVILLIYEILQENSHYILYVESLIVLKACSIKHLFFRLQNQLCIAQTALYSDIVLLQVQDFFYYHSSFSTLFNTTVELIVLAEHSSHSRNSEMY